MRYSLLFSILISIIVGQSKYEMNMIFKSRGIQNQDKLSCELNIGSRKFKCTTMPIYRDGYGLVGAICINVDYHYLDQEVRNNQKRLNDFLDSFLKTDMVLDENILSKNEYEKALAGKTHFRDS